MPDLLHDTNGVTPKQVGLMEQPNVDNVCYSDPETPLPHESLEWVTWRGVPSFPAPGITRLTHTTTGYFRIATPGNRPMRDEYPWWEDTLISDKWVGQTYLFSVRVVAIDSLLVGKMRASAAASAGPPNYEYLASSHSLGSGFGDVGVYSAQVTIPAGTYWLSFELGSDNAVTDLGVTVDLTDFMLLRIG